MDILLISIAGVALCAAVFFYVSWKGAMKKIAIIPKNAALQNQSAQASRKTEVAQSKVPEVFEVERKRFTVEQKKEDFTKTLQFATFTQGVILGDPQDIAAKIKHAFVLHKPKEVVGGDFFWFCESNFGKPLKVIVVGDCPGHGAAGAFMSLMMAAILNEFIGTQIIREPDKLLYELDYKINGLAKKLGSKVADGIDVSVLVYDQKSKKILYAGAKTSLCIVRNGELTHIRGSKFAIGPSLASKSNKLFDLHHFACQTGDVLYLYSDGFSSQFGGVNKEKYTNKRFKDYLSKICNFPIEIQEVKLEKELHDWRGDNSLTDDVLVLGIRVDDEEA